MSILDKIARVVRAGQSAARAVRNVARKPPPKLVRCALCAGAPEARSTRASYVAQPSGMALCEEHAHSFAQAAAERDDEIELHELTAADHATRGEVDTSK